MDTEAADLSPVVAVTPDRAAVAAGVSRTKIFEEIRTGRLTARKSGKTTLIELAELKRWIRSLPTRRPHPTAA